MLLFGHYRLRALRSWAKHDREDRGCLLVTPSVPYVL